MEKVWCVYNGISLGHSKEGNNSTCSKVDGPGDCQRRRNIVTSLRCGVCKNTIQMNLLTKQRLRDLENALTADGGKG